MKRRMTQWMAVLAVLATVSCGMRTVRQQESGDGELLKTEIDETVGETCRSATCGAAVEDRTGEQVGGSVTCGAAGCGDGAGEDTGSDTIGQGEVEVLCFYGRQRCITCRTVENLAREVVTTRFAGQVRFRTIDIERAENASLTEKYAVAWSSLLIVKREGATERVEDLTGFAFGHARTEPEAFRDRLTERLTHMLE